MTSPHPFPTQRTAVITGGASPRGIGRATADRLARDGWSVAILDIDGVAAKLAAAELADKYSVSTLGVGADISDENSVQSAITQVESTLPPIIGLANVAGVSSPTEFMDVTPAEWDRVFNVNMRGTFLVTQRVLPAMIAAGVGRIVSQEMHALDDGIATDDELLPSRQSQNRCVVPQSKRFRRRRERREIARDQGELVEPSFPLLILSHGL